jgi:hypothetical protein
MSAAAVARILSRDSPNAEKNVGKFCLASEHSAPIKP